MPSLNIAVSAEQEALIRRLIETGIYTSPEGVVAEALTQLEALEDNFASRRAEIEASIEEGLADIRAGRVYDAAEVFAELDEIIAAAKPETDAAA